MDCERQLTSWARITISPVCRISVDFPPMFGPVTMTTRLPACSSPISSESWLHASIHTHTHRGVHTHTHNRQTKMLQKWNSHQYLFLWIIRLESARDSFIHTGMSLRSVSYSVSSQILKHPVNHTGSPQNKWHIQNLLHQFNTQVTKSLLCLIH